MSWEYTYNPHLWPAFFTALLTILLGLYSWHHRNVRGAKPFAVVCLFATLWAAASTLEAMAADLSTQVFWIKFQATWQLPTATAILYFVLEYSGSGRWLTRRKLYLLTIVPILTLLLIVTNDYHHFIWTNFSLGPYVIQSFGPANWFLLAYALMLALATISVLSWMAVRLPYRRGPVAVMLFGQITGLTFYIVGDIFPGFLSPHIRILCVLGSLSLAYAFALFRLHAFDPVPAARTAVIEQTLEGMIVVDLQGQIVDLNPAAAKALGKPAKELRKIPVAKLMPKIPLLDKSGTAKIEIDLSDGVTRRYYTLALTPLTDRQGQPLGQLLLLHNVTEQKLAQSKVIEQRHVMATLEERARLARELHDGMGQVIGFINVQAQAIQQYLSDGNIDRAKTMIARLIQVSKDAHIDLRESIYDLKIESPQTWAFIPAVKKQLNDFQSTYKIHTELTIDDGFNEETISPETGVQLLRVMQESLANIRKHSEADLVKVSIETKDLFNYITIADNGRGFDIGHPIEDSEKHFGLSFMRERMEQINGDIVIESQPDAGTVLKLSAPVINYTRVMNESPVSGL